MPHSPHTFLNDFALRSLRETADKDYIHARLAYRAKLIPQFLWSSLHCLEKYVKCILVLNRIDARKIKHEISSGLTTLENQGRFSVLLSDPAKNFVSQLEDGARFRYYEISYYSKEIDLPRLDKTVWELRRYCQLLDYDFEIEGRQVNQLEANLNRIREALDSGEKGTCINGGWLERVISEEQHAARKSLLWKNLFFGKHPRKSIVIKRYLEAGNSPLFLHPEIVDEVAKYIYLPEAVKSGYRELYKQQLAGKE